MGGTGGIGSALAVKMAKLGAKVVIAGRNQSKAEEIANGINAYGGEVYPIQIDVTDPSSVQNLAGQISTQFGKLDILINAFGQGIIQSIKEIEPQNAKEIIDVNVFGTYLVTQAMLPILNEERSDVVMFPGTMGKYIMKNSSVYSASKFAIQGFTKALTEELKREKIRFTLFYLGGVNTEFWDDERVQMRVKKEAMLSPEAVANTVVATLALPGTAVVNEVVMQPESHQLV